MYIVLLTASTPDIADFLCLCFTFSSPQLVCLQCFCQSDDIPSVPCSSCFSCSMLPMACKVLTFHVLLLTIWICFSSATYFPLSYNSCLMDNMVFVDPGLDRSGLVFLWVNIFGGANLT